MDKIDRLVKFIREEGGIVNNVGDGKIAGTIEGSNYDPNFSPPVKKRKKKIIGLGRGSRKRWMV